jgi:hypothetical protein
VTEPRVDDRVGLVREFDRLARSRFFSAISPCMILP